MKNEEKEIITYSDLSLGLKIPIVVMWIIGILWASGFIVGFIQGIASLS